LLARRFFMVMGDRQNLAGFGDLTYWGPSSNPAHRHAAALKRQEGPGSKGRRNLGQRGPAGAEAGTSRRPRRHPAFFPSSSGGLFSSGPISGPPSGRASFSYVFQFLFQSQAFAPPIISRPQSADPETHGGRWRHAGAPPFSSKGRGRATSPYPLGQPGTRMEGGRAQHSSPAFHIYVGRRAVDLLPSCSFVGSKGLSLGSPAQPCLGLDRRLRAPAGGGLVEIPPSFAGLKGTSSWTGLPRRLAPAIGHQSRITRGRGPCQPAIDRRLPIGRAGAQYVRRTRARRLWDRAPKGICYASALAGLRRGGAGASCGVMFLTVTCRTEIDIRKKTSLIVNGDSRLGGFLPPAIHRQAAAGAFYRGIRGRAAGPFAGRENH